jgi:hypothetical protein
MKFKMNKHKLRLTFMAVFGMVNLRYSDFMNTVGCLFDMVVTRYILDVTTHIFRPKSFKYIRHYTHLLTVHFFVHETKGTNFKYNKV